MYLRSIHQIGLIFLCLNYSSSYLVPCNSIDTKTDSIFESSCTWFDNSSILWFLLAFGNFLLILSNCCRLLPTLLSISDLLNFLRWTFDSFNPVFYLGGYRLDYLSQLGVPWTTSFYPPTLREVIFLYLVLIGLNIITQCDFSQITDGFTCDNG